MVQNVQPPQTLVIFLGGVGPEFYGPKEDSGRLSHRLMPSDEREQKNHALVKIMNSIPKCAIYNMLDFVKTVWSTAFIFKHERTGWYFPQQSGMLVRTPTVKTTVACWRQTMPKTIRQ